MPSRSETFGLVALESAASGTPVIGYTAADSPSRSPTGSRGCSIDSRDPRGVGERDRAAALRRAGARSGSSSPRGTTRSASPGERPRRPCSACTRACSDGCCAVAAQIQSRGRPYASSSRSQTSLIVGYAGTACQRRSSGTSPTIAIVAECSSSRDIRPDEGDAEEHLAVLVDDHARLARVVVGLDASPRRPSTGRSRRRGCGSPAFSAAAGGQPDRGDLRVGEGDLRHRGVVGGRDVGAPRRVVDGLRRAPARRSRRRRRGPGTCPGG